VRSQVALLSPLVPIIPYWLEQPSLDQAVDRLVERAPTLLQRLPIRWLVDRASVDRSALGSLGLGDGLDEDEQLSRVEIGGGVVCGTCVLRERQQAGICLRSKGLSATGETPEG
jgi:hypothetical protein